MLSSTGSEGDTVVIFNDLSCSTSFYSNQENVNSNQGQIAFTKWLLCMLGAVPSPIAWLGWVPFSLNRAAESDRKLC